MKINNINLKNILSIIDTIKLIFKIEPKNFMLVIFFSILNGIFPILSIDFSQELINSLTSVTLSKEYIMKNFLQYILVTIVIHTFIKLSNYIEDKFQLNLSFKLNYMLIDKIADFELAEIEYANTYNKIRKITQEQPISHFKYLRLFTV